MTNAMIIPFDNHDSPRPLINMYCHQDGNPEVLGVKLAKFLLTVHMVRDDEVDYNAEFTNGMPCLAAQIVAHFKKAPYDVYLFAPTNHKDNETNFTYEIRYECNLLLITIKYNVHSILFKGTPKDIIIKYGTEEDIKSLRRKRK
jgi:hypothetical protein